MSRAILSPVFQPFFAGVLVELLLSSALGFCAGEVRLEVEVGVDGFEEVDSGKDDWCDIDDGEIEVFVDEGCGCFVLTILEYTVERLAGAGAEKTSLVGWSQSLSPESVLLQQRQAFIV